MQALDDPDANVRFHAIESLGRLAAPAAINRLIEIAESRDFFLAFPAIDALVRINDPLAVVRLTSLLSDPLLGGHAADALGRLGDEDAVTPLTQALDDPATSTGCGRRRPCQHPRAIPGAVCRGGANRRSRPAANLAGWGSANPCRDENRIRRRLAQPGRRRRLAPRRGDSTRPRPSPRKRRRPPRGDRSHGPVREPGRRAADRSTRRRGHRHGVRRRGGAWSNRRSHGRAGVVRLDRRRSPAALAPGHCGSGADRRRAGVRSSHTASRRPRCSRSSSRHRGAQLHRASGYGSPYLHHAGRPQSAGAGVGGEDRGILRVSRVHGSRVRAMHRSRRVGPGCRARAPAIF